MTDTRRSSKSQIEKLVRFFEQNIHQLKSQSFNETQARMQLIDPLFEALGWDVHNRSMKPLYLQEVVPEGRVKTHLSKEVKEQEALFETKNTLGKTHREYASILDYIAEDNYKASSKEAIKKPDYRFRIRGQTRFFVEAKKPFVDLSKSMEAIFQVKRYGFSGRVPVSILTDFEEFRTFDCTHKPQFDKPKLGIIKELDLRYEQYLDEFDHLYDTFSREAVEAGSLDTLTRKLLRKKTGDFALDKHFLEDLSRWREELARDIAKHPRNRRRLNDYTLNESVQRILDRIVFFRVCEDREIEVENTLLAILQMWQGRPGISLYSLLNDLFKQRRSLYNGLLFAPHECEDLEVGNEVLLKILEGLNYPFSPYYFNEIGVEILGSIYEKFLGKTIHLTPKTVRVDEKPEVRKAGGVYYTPQYIVNYIVDNTLGKLLYEDVLSSPSQGEVSRRSRDGGVEEKANPLRSKKRIASPLKEGTKEGRVLRLSPKQVAKLKIIDIACGSGSFLLGAFQKLIDYHVEWYQSHPKDIQTVNNAPDAYKDANGNLHLSPRKKRDILVNNIYGVDIDRQAVEVTQMSLYLKVLEGENAETLNPQMTLALKEVYLPELTGNIKCGNSLIGTDFTSQGALFDDEMRHKVNPFDWETEFPEILGKPPSTLSFPNVPLSRIPLPERDSESGTSIGNPEQDKQLDPRLKRAGMTESSRGFDVVIGNPPYSLMIDDTQKEYLRGKYRTLHFKINLFACFCEKSIDIAREGGYISYIVPNLLFANDSLSKLREKFASECSILKLINCGDGVFEKVSMPTMIYVLKKGAKSNNSIEIYPDAGPTLEVANKILIKQDRILSAHNHVFETSRQDVLGLLDKLRKYEPFERILEINQGIITGNDKKLLSEKPQGKKWKQTIRGKDIERYSTSYPELFVKYARDELACPRTEDLFDVEEKILMRRTGDLPIASYDNERSYNLHTLYSCRNKSELSLKYILGTLNSNLLKFVYQSKLGTEVGRTFAEIKIVYVRPLPIRTIDFTNPAEKQMHDDLVALVDQMLELHKQLNKVSFDSEKEAIQRQIAATERKIDTLVYELYGLTEEEIKIVEGK